jgi:transposase
LPWFDHDRYRSRSALEQSVGWLKENRRIGTRYEKLSRNYLAMVQLAMFQRCLRKIGPVNRA